MTLKQKKRGSFVFLCLLSFSVHVLPRQVIYNENFLLVYSFVGILITPTGPTLKCRKARKKDGRIRKKKTHTHSTITAPNKTMEGEGHCQPHLYCIQTRCRHTQHSTHTRSGFLTFQWSLKLVRYCKSRNVVWTGFFLILFFYFYTSEPFVEIVLSKLVTISCL